LIFFVIGFKLQFIALAILIFALEAAWTAKAFFQKTLKHPVITNKTRILIFTTHILAFLFVIFLFSKYLGEMSLLDFSLAALGLLLFDLLAPIFVSAVVLILQPITVIGRNKLIAKAKQRRGEFKNLTVIGVTGSYGKSLAKELVAHILSSRQQARLAQGAAKFKVAKTQANQNSEVGVSRTILNELKMDTQILVVEMAGYNRGGIKLLCEIARPAIGMITGINEQHLATFGSLKNIMYGKFELAEYLPPDSTLVLNWDSEMVRHGYDASKNLIDAKKTVFCSALGEKDIWASEVSVFKDRLSFVVRLGIDSFQINTNARGAHNVIAILMASAVAMDLGMSIDQIKTALENYDFSLGGIKVYPGVNGATILDSTYSANPDGVLAHLEYLKLWPGKKAIIMPCLIELGSLSKAIHEMIGKKIAESCDLAIITTGDRFHEIKSGALGAGMKKENIIFQENPKKIQSLIKNRLTNGDTILLEGRLAPGIIGAIGK
jgi:UDP-N-acetylmuramoyl-tripeptide--D-alanyl-D-alanine ligase